MREILPAVKRELEGLTMFKNSTQRRVLVFLFVLFIPVAGYRDSILPLGLWLLSFKLLASLASEFKVWEVRGV